MNCPDAADAVVRLRAAGYAWRCIWGQSAQPLALRGDRVWAGWLRRCALLLRMRCGRAGPIAAVAGGCSAPVVGQNYRREKNGVVDLDPSCSVSHADWSEERNTAGVVLVGGWWATVFDALRHRSVSGVLSSCAQHIGSVFCAIRDAI